MKKNLHELERAVEPMGFHYVGLDGADHYTFLNADTGAVIKAANSSHVDVTRQVQRLRAAANRSKVAQKGLSAEWVAWLREKYGIGIASQKEVSMILGEEWTAFLADRHGGVRRGSRQLPYMALKSNPNAEMISRGTGDRHGTSNPSIWLLSGPLFGVHTDTEEMKDESGIFDFAGGVPAPAPSVPAPAPAVSEDAGSDGGSQQGEPVVEPDRPRVEPGLSIPGDLAASLLDALGGDLRAENELLRAAIAEAVTTLSEALSLHDAPEPRASRMGPTQNPVATYVPRKGAIRDPEKFGGLGRVRLTDLHALEVARDAGTLPDPFHVSQADEMINRYMAENGMRSRTSGAVNGTLHAADIHGVLKRVQRGWFTWAK
jgi:hypothetical protein